MSNATIDAILAAAKNKQGAIKSRAKTIKPKDGANRYVILPGWSTAAAGVFFHDFGQHFIKNGAKELQAIYPCLEKTFNKPCPVCQAISQASTSVTDDAQIELLKEANSSQSFLLNVIALDSDSADPQILEVRKTVFGQILELMEDWGVKMFDPQSPLVIKVIREGQGKNTKYSVQPTMNEHKLPAGVLDRLNNLDEYVRQENEENMQRALSAVRNVVGLPSPATGGEQPKTLTYEQVETHEAARTVEAGRATAQDISLDSELDDLLGEAG